MDIILKKLKAYQDHYTSENSAFHNERPEVKLYAAKSSLPSNLDKFVVSMNHLTDHLLDSGETKHFTHFIIPDMKYNEDLIIFATDIEIDMIYKYLWELSDDIAIKTLNLYINFTGDMSDDRFL